MIMMLCCTARRQLCIFVAMTALDLPPPPCTCDTCVSLASECLTVISTAKASGQEVPHAPTFTKPTKKRKYAMVDQPVVATLAPPAPTVPQPPTTDAIADTTKTATIHFPTREEVAQHNKLTLQQWITECAPTQYVASKDGFRCIPCKGTIFL